MLDRPTLGVDTLLLVRFWFAVFSTDGLVVTFNSVVANNQKIQSHPPRRVIGSPIGFWLFVGWLVTRNRLSCLVVYSKKTPGCEKQAGASETVTNARISPRRQW